MTTTEDLPTSCPVPLQDHACIVMAHGGGGTMMHRLLDEVFLRAFDSATDQASTRHDAAVIDLGGVKLAFTTDSFVVSPLFFPGGDIGSLAVHGTVNDLAMSGARPLCLSAAFILEEGFPIEQLRRCVDSMQAAAENAGVRIVTGDTKVVDRGKGDGLFINTAGIGVIEHSLTINPSAVRAGDAVLVNGDLGRHGIAIIACREGLEFETTVESDSAALADLVLTLIDAGVEIHCLRDLTRGGLASALNEIASAARLGIHLRERAIPVRPDVAGACEILGFDPLYVACEGRLVLFVPDADVEKALTVMKRHPLGGDARQIGVVEESSGRRVTLRTVIGAARIVDMLSGEQLPRIC